MLANHANLLRSGSALKRSSHSFRRFFGIHEKPVCDAAQPGAASRGNQPYDKRLSTNMTNSKIVQLLHIQDDNRVFVDMADDESNPCLSCGACCQHFRVSMYMGEMASSPGGTVPDELVSAVNPVIVCMKGTEAGYGRCVALRGVVGKPGIRCEIYPLRPSPCREYRVWLEDGTPNPDCQRLRKNIGLVPLKPRSAVPGIAQC
jgi:Fe-S-cluster containining protein